LLEGKNLGNISGGGAISIKRRRVSDFGRSFDD